MPINDRHREDGLEIIALYCEGCGRRRTGRKHKAAMVNCVLMCPKDPETGAGCGKETQHHLTLDKEKCPCYRLRGKLSISPKEMASLFEEVRS